MLNPELLEKVGEQLTKLEHEGRGDHNAEDESLLTILSWGARSRPPFLPLMVEEIVNAAVADLHLQIAIAHAMGYDLFQLREREASQAIYDRINMEMARLLEIPFIKEGDEGWDKDDPRKNPPTVGLAIFANEDGISVSTMTEDEFDKRSNAGQN